MNKKNLLDNRSKSSSFSGLDFLNINLTFYFFQLINRLLQTSKQSVFNPFRTLDIILMNRFIAELFSYQKRTKYAFLIFTSLLP